MVITLPTDLTAALSEQARRRGVAPECAGPRRAAAAFPFGVRRPGAARRVERRLLGLAKDCGVSLSDEALSREELYE